MIKQARFSGKGQNERADRRTAGQIDLWAKLIIQIKTRLTQKSLESISISVADIVKKKN